MRMIKLFGKFEIDYALLISFIVLTCLGILTIYSVSREPRDTSVLSRQYIKQIYWAISAFVFFLVFIFINYQKLGEYSFFIYIGCILLLFITLLLGKRVRGAKSWITIYSNFGFQPSEFVKIGVIISLARFLDKIGEDIKSLRNVLISFLIVILPVGLIILQPDLGTAFVYIPIWFVMLFFSGVKYSHIISILMVFGIAVALPLLTTFSKLTLCSYLEFLQVLDNTRTVLLIALIFGVLSLIAFAVYRIKKRDILEKATNIFVIFFLGLVCAAFLNKFLKPYQKERLIVFLKPTIDPFGAGYNIIQSKIAVGAGSLFGKGLLGGTQSQLGFLPERSTDFIFSIFAEEWGFVGSLLLIFLFGLFIYRGVTVIFRAKDRFGCLLASGIVAMFLFHIISNIGMTIGIMPITGIPLPFLSYGGSFLVTCAVATSILFNIEMRRYLR